MANKVFSIERRSRILRSSIEVRLAHVPQDYVGCLGVLRLTNSVRLKLRVFQPCRWLLKLHVRYCLFGNPVTLNDDVGPLPSTVRKLPRRSIEEQPSACDNVVDPGEDLALKFPLVLHGLCQCAEYACG